MYKWRFYCNSLTQHHYNGFKTTNNPRLFLFPHRWLLFFGGRKRKLADQPVNKTRNLQGRLCIYNHNGLFNKMGILSQEQNDEGGALVSVSASVEISWQRVDFLNWISARDQYCTPMSMTCDRCWRGEHSSKRGGKVMKMHTFRPELTVYLSCLTSSFPRLWIMNKEKTEHCLIHPWGGAVAHKAGFFWLNEA